MTIRPARRCHGGLLGAFHRRGRGGFPATGAAPGRSPKCGWPSLSKPWTARTRIRVVAVRSALLGADRGVPGRRRVAAALSDVRTHLPVVLQTAVGMPTPWARSR